LSVLESINNFLDFLGKFEMKVIISFNKFVLFVCELKPREEETALI